MFPISTMVLETTRGRRVRIISVDKWTGTVKCIDLATGLPIRMGRSDIRNLPKA